MKPMKWSLLVVLVVISSLLSTATSAVAADPKPRDARIGGTRESFEKKYGDPIDPSENGDYASASYDVDGYAMFGATFYKDKVTTISFYSDREDDLNNGTLMSEPDDANWDKRKAARIAKLFLPRDVECSEEPFETDAGNLEYACHSIDLEKAFNESTLSKLEANGERGDCFFRIYLDEIGDVYAIDIQLGNGTIGEPDEAPATNDLSQDESAYLLQITDISSRVVAALSDINSLMQDSRVGQDDWIVDLATALVAIQIAYQDALIITPPAVFAETHALFLQAMELYNSATDDIAKAFDLLDASYIDSATDKILLANTYMAQVNEEIDKIKAERGIG